MRYIIYSVIVLLLTGCVTTPQSYEKESTMGRIILYQWMEGDKIQHSGDINIIPLGNSFMILPEFGSESAKGKYIYTIQKEHGGMIRTSSRERFSIGDCVRLWHVELQAGNNTNFNFTEGTLLNEKNCKN